MTRAARRPTAAAFALLLAACPGARALPSAAEPGAGAGGGGGDGECEADEAGLMQRKLRTAIQSDQGPFRGPGSVAHVVWRKMVPDSNETTSIVDFDCQGRYYRVRFEGGYGRGQWCLTDHGDDGVFTKAEAETALKYDALNRLGLEIGPLDWYGYMRANQTYQVRYDDGGNLELEDLGPCTGTACTDWQNPAPTEGEILNGFKYPPYEEVPEAEAPRKQFTATWCNYTQVDKPEHPDCSGLDVSNKASVFGQGGLLRISTEETNLTIPHIVDVDIMNKTLPLYGASLIPHGTPLPAATLNVTLLSYSFAPSFEDAWVYSEDGPGMFLEHHMFTHYFMNPTGSVYPAQNGTEAAVVSLARQVNPSEDCQAKACAYWITAFSVPSGYTIHCPPGCIHEDWTNRDKEVTSLADYVEADIVNDNTVYLRNKNLEKIRLTWSTVRPNTVTVGEAGELARGEVKTKSGSVAYDKVDVPANPKVCPGSRVGCAGNQCCPGTGISKGKTFPCPDAAAGWNGCEAPAP